LEKANSLGDEDEGKRQPKYHYIHLNLNVL
jgi:hypothetical protein